MLISDAHKTLAQRLATPVEEDIELKTICSALKLYLRTLKEPVFTFKLHNRFIDAASIDRYLKLFVLFVSMINQF